MNKSTNTGVFILSFAKGQRVTLTTSEVIWLLSKTGHTVTSIASEIGFSRPQTSACINGREHSPKVRQALIPVLEKLWVQAGKESSGSALRVLKQHAS